MTACAPPSKLAGFRASATWRASTSASMLSDWDSICSTSRAIGADFTVPRVSAPSGASPSDGRPARAQGVGERRAGVQAGLPAAGLRAGADPGAVDGRGRHRRRVAGGGVGRSPAGGGQRPAEQRAVDDDAGDRGAGRHGGDDLGGELGDRRRARIGLRGVGPGQRDVTAADEDHLPGVAPATTVVSRVCGSRVVSAATAVSSRGGRRGGVVGVLVEQHIPGGHVHDLRGDAGAQGGREQRGELDGEGGRVGAVPRTARPAPAADSPSSGSFASATTTASEAAPRR